MSWLRFPGIWAIVAGATQAFVGYAWVYYGWSVFVRFFATELGWSSATIGLGASIGRLAGVVGSPVGGWAVDHWGPRWASIVFQTLMGFSWIGLAYMTEVWHMILWYGVVMYFFYYGGLYRISYTAVNRWWVNRRAMGIALVAFGGGLSGVVFLAPLALTIETYGWRPTAWIAAISTVAISVAVAPLYATYMPEHYGLNVDNLSPADRRARAELTAAQRGGRPAVRPFLANVTTGQALTSFSFWMLCLSGFCWIFAIGPLPVFQNVRMGQLGYSPAEAAAWFSLNNAMSFVGRGIVLFFGDWLGARFPVRFNLAAFYFLMALGLVFFAIGANAWYFYAWTLCYGIGFGFTVPYIAVLLGAYFGRSAFGTIYGLREGLSSLGGVVSPFLIGWLSDVRAGDWVAPFIIAAAGQFLAGLLVLLAVPPREQVRERRGAT